MKIDLQLFREILSFDSTSGSEEALAGFLEGRLPEWFAAPDCPAAADVPASPENVPGVPEACQEFPGVSVSAPLQGTPATSPKLQSWPVPEGGRNLLFSWGTPRVVFCTHLDTVPPYIPPTLFPSAEAHLTHNFGEGTSAKTAENALSPVEIFGRGACDAKGQMISMLAACKELSAEGFDGFALLLVSGEETGSWGAKAFSKTGFKAPYLIVGEPTDNKMVSASKGTKAFELTFHGEAFHSGYPQWGRSAVDIFVDFVSALRKVDFGEDPLLGATTWNIGRLVSDNPQNVLSPELRCRLYFRTTFLSDGRVEQELRNLAAGCAELSAERSCEGRAHGGSGADSCRLPVVISSIGGDSPSRYLTLPLFDSAPVSFGSDAPHLSGFEHKIICGPGSIRFAHRDDEHITLSELEKAAEQYVAMFKTLNA